jgi:hypothetical protein
VALGALAGFLLQRFAGLDTAPLAGLFLGILAANFVPLPNCDDGPRT